MHPKDSCVVCSQLFNSSYGFIQHLLSSTHHARFHKKDWLSMNKNLWLQVEGYRKKRKKEKGLDDDIILGYFYKYGIANSMINKDGCLIQFKSRQNLAKVASQEHVIKNLKIYVNKLKNKPKGDNTTVPVKKLSENLLTIMKNIMNPAQLNDCILSIVDEIGLTPAEISVRQMLTKKILSCLRYKYPKCDIFAFGSSVNGLGFSGCDLDVCTNIGFPDNGIPLDRNTGITITNSLTKIIRNSRMAYNIQPISKARVPIVKFVDQLTDIHIDLSFKNAFPYYNTVLIKNYVDNNSAVKPFIMMLRYWAKLEGISGGGNPLNLLTNYAFTILCLFYLMVRKQPVIPPLSVLQKEYLKYYNNQPVMVEGWDCSFIVDMKMQHNTYVPTIELVREFFEFYSILDTKHYVISPMVGGLIKINTLQEYNSNSACPELDSYYKMGELFKGSHLNIQDPFILSVNLTKPLTEKSCFNFQQKCKQAAEICKNIIEENLPLLALFEPELDMDAILQEIEDSSDEISSDDEEPLIINEIINNSVYKPKQLVISDNFNSHMLPVPNKYNFNFFFSKPISISIGGTVSKFNKDDSMILTASNMILIIMEKILKYSLSETDCKNCEKKCILNRRCVLHWNLSKNRKQMKKCIPISDQNPFMREIQTSEKLISTFNKKALTFNKPYQFDVHVCEVPDVNNMFKVSCHCFNKEPGINNRYDLFSSIVSSVMKKIEQMAVNII